jgi:transposase-like protein
MARHRTHSIEFKRQVAQDYLAGETLHSLARRHDLSRNLIRIWLQKFEAGAFDGFCRKLLIKVRCGMTTAAFSGAVPFSKAAILTAR